MLKKVLSYPRWVGPIEAVKGLNRIGKEINALPGYKELNRESMRYFWTGLFWMSIPLILIAVWAAIN